MTTNSLKEAFAHAKLLKAPPPPVLKETLAQWAEDDAPHKQMLPAKPKASLFQPTTNVTKATFEYVRDNPGHKHAEIRETLAAQGHTRSSVDSLLYQMKGQDVIHQTSDGGYKTELAAFPGLKSSSTLRRQREAQALADKKAAANAKRSATMKAKAKRGAKVVHVGEEKLSSAPHMPAKTADTILAGLSVFEAKQVFEALKQLFKE